MRGQRRWLVVNKRKAPFINYKWNVNGHSDDDDAQLAPSWVSTELAWYPSGVFRNRINGSKYRWPKANKNVFSCCVARACVRFQTLKGFFRLLRPYGWLLCFIFILFLIVFQNGQYDFKIMGLAVITVALTSAGGYAFNDYFDCESDAIEHPERPIPSKQVTPAQSVIFGALMFLAASCVSLLINPLAFEIVVLVIVFLILYPSIVKKSSGFLSNIAIGFVEGISVAVFAEAALFQRVSIMSLSFIGFAFVGIGGNVLTDIVGVEGDRKMGLSTLAVTHGTRTASQVGALILFCASIVSILPYFVGVVSVFYLVPIVLWVCILFYLAVPFFKEQNVPHMEKRIRMIKASFVLFLIALILGTFA